MTPLELGIAAEVLVAGAALLLAFRRRGAPEPVIEASVKTLREGLYQVDIKITNRAPHAVAGESLRRVRPHSAKLLAPIRQVSTRDGDFQVWSDPEADKPAARIPIDLVLGPWQPPDGIVSLSAEGHVAVWLFLPRPSDLGRLVLELSLSQEGGRQSRHRFGVTPAGA